MKPVVFNNEACILINRGCIEGAIKHLNEALLALFVLRSNSRVAFSKRPHQQICFDGTVTGHDDPPHYYPPNEYDEGMRTYSEPLSIACRCADAGQAEATIFFNLGIAHSRLGEESEALVYFEKSYGVQRSRTTFCETIITGPSLHSILHNIGHCHWRSGKHNIAISTYEQALELLSENCAVNHLEISCTLNCIAVTRYSANDCDCKETAKILVKALALRVVDPRYKCDRETATMINNHGRVSFVRGDFETALAIYEEAYRLRKVVLGDNHMDVAASLYNMAQTEEYLDHIPEAIRLYKQFLSIVQENMGEGNKDVADALLLIGQLSYKKKDLKQAFDYFSRALKSAKLAVGPIDEMIASIMNKLGNVLYDLGKYDLALESYQEGLAMERTLYPLFDENIVVTLLNAARICQHKKNWDEALGFYTEALIIKRYHENKESVACVLSKIGLIYEAKGELKLAARALEEVVELQREIGQDFQLSSTLNALGLVQYSDGCFDMALSSFCEAIKIRSSLSGIHPRDIVTLYFNAAKVYNSIGETDKALQFFEKTLCLEQMRNEDENNHEDVASLYREIGFIFKKRGNFDGALRFFRLASEMCLEYADLIDRMFAYKSFKILGDLYLQVGESDKALQSYCTAMRIVGADQETLIGHNSDNLYELVQKTNPPAAAAA